MGNRVTVFNLVDNTTFTFPFSHRKNISRIAISTKDQIILSVDEDGRSILTHLFSGLELYHFNFKSPVTALAFSPCGRYFAAALRRKIEVWRIPESSGSDGLEPLGIGAFELHHRHTQHFDDVRYIEWSSDSRFFLSASKDLTARIWSLDAEEGFRPTVLSGHRQPVIGAWFSKDQETIYTLSEDGAVFEWKYAGRRRNEDEMDEDEQEEDESKFRWRIINKHYFMQNNASARCAAFHPKSNLLVVGFSNGVFGLYEMPDFICIHTLSISQKDIDYVTINDSAEWLAFGASKLGQLLVWEWQSESYILKQQGHFDTINALAYSPDGRQIVTAADDGKVKVWDTESGFCVVTLSEHTSGVTACEFAKKASVVFTASLDGSVRAWDLARYRNFRTFTAPTKMSFSCLAVDPSGEVVAAGSPDSFDIHVWSVQTGQLLDQLSGHEGPVSALAFAPQGGVLVSGSFDHTARIWQVFGRTQTSEQLQLQADVLDVAISPNSQQAAISTLDGQVTFWSISDAEQQNGLDGRRDASGGRKVTDRRTAANTVDSKAFNTIRYSADGSCILAGGNSKYICLYSTTGDMVLLNKYTVSVNLSLTGTQEFLSSRNMTEAGPRELIDDDSDSDRDHILPGTKRGDPSSRKYMPEVRVTSVGFSPDASSFCAASTEGLLVYSLDKVKKFDPFDLQMDITPASTLAALQQQDYVAALVMAFRLNDTGLVKKVFFSIPRGDIELTVKSVPSVYVQRLLRFIAGQLEASHHLEFCLLWFKAITNHHAEWLYANLNKLDTELRQVEKGLRAGEVRRVVEQTRHMYKMVMTQAELRKERGEAENGAVDVDET